MTAGFVVVLTVLAGMANVKNFVARCPDMACVEKIEHDASAGGHLDRLRVWKASDYNPIETGGQNILPPLIDRSFL
ncbi:MAG: hypothetical protein ACREDH_15545 [Methylocella sp.]